MVEYDKIFKFTLLGIEFTGKRKESVIEYDKGEKAMTRQQRKFSKAVKKCHRITFTPKNFGRCMKKNLS